MRSDRGPGGNDYGNRSPTPESAPVVRTFLIVDVRGYTRFTHAHGDEAARDLAARLPCSARGHMPTAKEFRLSSTLLAHPHIRSVRHVFGRRKLGGGLEQGFDLSECRRVTHAHE